MLSLSTRPGERGTAARGLLVVTALLAASPAAAELVRGPYLQQVTEDGALVRWRVDPAGAGWVRWGTSPGDLDRETASPAAADHEVVLDGLAPSTRYWYAVGSGETVLAGGDGSLSFLTAPATGAAVPLRIWAFGDSGTGTPLQAAVRDGFAGWAGARHPDVWLLLGDNAYDFGSDLEYQANFFEVYPELLARVAAWSTFGNHEVFSSSSMAQFGPYYDMFTFPTAGEAGGEPSGTEAYYSFDVGNVHFVCLNSEDVPRDAEEGDPLAAMADWLRRDLAANEQPWTFAFFHHPPYSKGSHDSDGDGDTPDSALSIRQMRENLLPILEAHGADLVLTGHSHTYERSVLLDGHYGTSDTYDPATMAVDPGDGRRDGDGAYVKPLGGGHGGTVYAVVGAAGSVTPAPLDHPVMEVSLEVAGTLVVDVAAGRLDAAYVDERGREHDRFTIFKGEGDRPPFAERDLAWTAPGTAVSVDLLANDEDPEGAPLAVTRIGPAAHGAVVDHGDGTISYAPAPGFSGRDSFVYELAAGGATNLGTVHVEVSENHPPVAVDDRAATERDLAVELDPLANDSDPEGEALALASLGEPAHGAVADLGGGRVRYTPEPGFTGEDSFVYEVRDPPGATSAATTTIDVRCPPSVEGEFFEDVEPEPAAGWTIDTAVNDNPASPVWAATEDPFAESPIQSFFTAAGVETQAKDDRLVSPPLDLSARSVLTFWHRFRIELGFDGGVLEISTDGGATWRDLGPWIVAGGYTGTIHPGSGTELAGRSAWTGGSQFWVNGMELVAVDLGAFAGEERRIRWRLVTDFITVEPYYGWFVDDVRVTRIEVEAGDCNRAPVAVDDVATTASGVPVTIDLLANDHDPDGDPLSASVTSPPAAGTVEDHGDGTVTYTPAAGFTGAETFAYEASDGRLASSATVTVTVEDGAAVHGAGGLADAGCVGRFSLFVRRSDGGETAGRLAYRRDCDGAAGPRLDGAAETLTTEGRLAVVSGSCVHWDGGACRFTLRAEDLGEPGAGADRLVLEVDAPDGSPLHRVDGTVTQGGVQVR